ncbi:UNVERIFIED_ORG: phage lysozyme [Burkholderia sp. CF145]|nr:glycoside hydrolase family protein [Paraburkholderia hospita]EUC18228.1 glycoside hydrolase family 24 [Burkholderia sp. BT03]SKC75540.1 Phage lysozyme [Paraburkholderia hospita]
MNAQQNNQPAAAPAASSPQTWRYPFPGKDHKEITDPDIFYHALAGMEDGFFPLGVNGFPHGGVHFGKGSSSRVDQSGGVRVIANGEVVAFRLDDAYAQLHFTQDRRWAMYSTGFVLVRHHMTMPPAPGNTANGQPADETLTFYSLYMHMADWSTYLADGSMVRPGWWPGVDAYRIGNKDKQENGGAAAGAFVWSEPRPGTKKNQFVAGQHVAFLPEGSEVLIGEKRGAWGHMRSISAGHMASANNGGYFGWEDQNVPWVQPDGDETGAIPITPEGDWGWLYLHDQQPVKEPQGVGRVVVPPQPIPVKAGTLMGQIGEYHDYERSTPLPPVPARQLLHLEVFAGDELKEFIGKCRARAAQLPASDRSVLVVQAGAKLVVQPADSDHKLGTRHPLYDAKETVRSPKAGPWVQVQPRYLTIGSIAALDGGPVWIRRDDLNRGPNGLSAWKRFPLQVQALADPANAQTFAFPRAQLDGIGDDNVAVDDENIHWWRVGFVAADGTDQRGWICEKGHPGTTLESPWAWPGSEIVDATGIALTDAFRRNLSVTGSADWKEQTEFEPSTAAVNGSALLRRLEQTVSRIPLQYGEKKSGKDGQEVVTARKLQRAMNKSWLASELAHVILRYESEWGGSMSRWEALTPLMRNARENWQCELTRIRKLQWWDDIKDKLASFPVTPVVNHIHPVALVANFFREAGARAISDNGIRFIFKQESLAGVTNKLHWPGGASGVTLGPGYDMKERSATSIQADMTAIGLDDATATTISRAAGLTGQSAKKFCHDNQNTVDLSETKQVELLRKVVPPYEKMVNHAIKVDLEESEFDALVSYAYNPGGGWSKVANYINQKDSNSAMIEIKKHVTSGGVTFAGLVKRRDDEVMLYTKGRYEFHGTPIVITH